MPIVYALGLGQRLACHIQVNSHAHKLEVEVRDGHATDRITYVRCLISESRSEMGVSQMEAQLDSSDTRRKEELSSGPEGGGE